MTIINIIKVEILPFIKLKIEYMDDIVIEQILYKFFYHTTYMADANQETKKESKIKKRQIINILELILAAVIGFLFGIFGGLIIVIPFLIILYVNRTNICYFVLYHCYITSYMDCIFKLYL
jgi:uncharacterized protein YqhQ